MKLNVGQMLTNRADLFGKKEGFVRGDVRLTFGELNARANAIAHYLIDRGYKTGDKLAIICKNNEHYVATFFAAAKIGLIVVAVSYKLKSREMAYIINHSEVKGIMYDGDFNRLIELVKPLVAVEHFFSDNGLKQDCFLPAIMTAYSNSEPMYSASGEDPVLMIYTSGTTGNPKGAMLSHNNLISSAISLSSTITWFETDRFLQVVPPFHIAGFIPIITNVHTGATTIFLEEFEPIRMWQLIEQEKITTLMSVPEMLAELIKAIDLMKPDLSSVRTITCGSATVSQQIIHVFKQFGVPVQQVYGLTEFAGSLTIWRSEFDDKKYGSKGKPVMYSELKVRSLETGEILPPNETGEIICRGPQLFLGYYKNEGATKEAMVDGWYRTGDIGHIDEEGFICLVDRLKDIIVLNGEKIYSAEVEQMLLNHPAIAEVAVIGIPRQDFGEIPIAYVVRQTDQAVTEQEIIGFCKLNLAPYKVIREVIFMDSLPRNSIGKLLKGVLRESNKKIVSKI